MTALTMAAPNATHHLLPALQTEWDSRLADTTAHWTSPELEPYRSPGEVLHAIRTAGRDREITDRLLHALITAALAGDELAGRTVLQAMTPKMYRLQWWARRRGITEPEEAVVEAMWTAIARFPLHRPRGVAGRLSLDCLHALQLRQAQERAEHESLRSPESITELEHALAQEADRDHRSRWDDDTTSIVELLRWALDTRTLSPADVRILALRHLGPDPRWASIGTELGISAATARQRGRRAQQLLVDKSLTSLIA